MKNWLKLLSFAIAFSSTLLGSCPAQAGTVQSSAVKSLRMAAPTQEGTDPPYYESFDEDSYLQSWTQINNNSNYWTWSRTSGVDDTGAATLRQSNGTWGEACDNWLISPPLNLKKGITYRTSFYVTNWFDASLHVYLLTSSTDTSGKTKILDYTGDEWDTYSKEFEVPADGVYYIGFYDDTPFQTNSTNLTYEVNIDDFHVDQVSNNAAPETVANLKSVPGENGDISMALSWTCPTLSKEGKKLDALSYVKIYKDKEEDPETITEGVVPGKQMTWTDPDPTAGRHTYRVVVANDQGESDAAIVNTYIGVDYAGAPQNATIDYDKEGEVINLEWEEPEFGVKGGWFDTTGLRYRVVRQPDGKVLATDLTETQFEDDSFDNYSNYYYQITSLTNAGVGGTATTGCVLAGSSAKLPIRENWEDKTTYSTWTIVDNNNDGHTWVFNGSYGNNGSNCVGYDYRQTSVAKDETLYSAPVELTAGKEYKVSFDVLNNVNGSFSLNVAYGKDKTMAAQTNTILALSDQASDDWSTMSKTFKPSESGTYYVSFWLHDSPCAFFYMDNIRIEEVLNKNLEATSVRNLNTDPTVGETLSTGVTYTNTGSGRSASKFTLQLLDDADNVLGSKTVSRALSAGASATANIQWTAPKEAGTFAVRGRVVMDGDECESDNTTAQSWLNIQPQGVKAVTIGTGTEVSGSIPFSSDGSTFFETVYHAKDMQNLAGKIDSLAIKVRMGQDRDYLKVPFRVYLGVTDRYDMNRGWIPVSEDMTEVFNGTLDFKRGSYELVIPFNEPFEYVGGNLAMLIIGDYDSSLFLNRGEGIGAYVSEAGLGASRNLAYYDVKQDPENPDDNAGNFYSLIPNTVFFFDHTKTGKVTGKVTDTEGKAVKGITVKQYEYDGNLSTTTDADGNYTFPYFPEGDVELTVSGNGYAEQEVDGEVEAGETLTLNIENVKKAQFIKAEGTVCDKIDNTKGIAGATVVLRGDNELETTTDADGKFSFEGVYEELPYTVTVKAADYESATFSKRRFSDGESVKFRLSPSTAAPSLVEAIDNGKTASVTWKEALQPITISKSDENPVGQFGGGNTALIIGHRYTPAELKTLGIDNDYYLTALRYVPMCTGEFSVNIWQGKPGNEALVYKETMTPDAYEEWNTFKLTKAYKIDPTQNLVFGYSVVANEGSYPVGFDAGPAVEGGDVLYDSSNNAWTTSHEVLPGSMNYNWSIGAVFGSNTNSAPVEWASTEASDHLQAAAQRKAKLNALSGTKELTSDVITLSQHDDNVPTADYQMKMLPKKKTATKAAAKAPVNKKPLGYNVYRLECGQEESSNKWTKLNDAALTTTSFTDDKWAEIDNKPYRFAVRASYGTPSYGKEVESDATFSDGIDKGRYASVSIAVATDNGNAEGAEVKLINSENTLTQKVGADGKASFSNVHFGKYTLQVLKPYYKRYAETVDINANEQSLTANVVFAAQSARQLDATDYIHEARLGWEAPTAALTDTLIKSRKHSSNISFNMNGAITVGAHFSPDDLKAYDYTDFYVDSICFRAGADMKYNLQLWEGLTDQEVIVWNKDVNVAKGDQWVSVALDTPLKLDPSKSYYVAYQVTPENGKYPFSIDEGPLNTGGCMMYGMDYSSYRYRWYFLGYNFNWEIGAHITNVPDPSKEDHSSISYNIYRMKAGDNADESKWTLVTKDTQTEPSYTDKTWEQAADADYKYAVKAMYFGKVASEPTFSKTLPKGKVSLATFNVTTNNELTAVGATVKVKAGDNVYSGVVGDDGKAVIPEITKGKNYEVTAALEGYDTLTVSHDFNEAEQTYALQLQETKLAPVMVRAKAATDNSSVEVTWRTPGSYAPVQGWAYWDNATPYGAFGSSTGSGSAAQLFDPQDQVAKGMKELYIKKIAFFPINSSNNPVSAGAKWTVKVWRLNGDEVEEVASQKAENVVMDEWNEVELASPYYISGDETLLIGYSFVGSGSVFGVDNGPCVKGKSDWANFGQGWVQLHSAASNFNYNNLIHAYCGSVDGQASAKAPALAAPEKIGGSVKSLNIVRVANVAVKNVSHAPLAAPAKAVKGYQVFRLVQGQENNPSLWTKLTPATITETTFTDKSWGSLAKKGNNYLWAVETVYASGNSEPEYSNVLDANGETGIETVTVSGVVIKQVADGEFRVYVPENSRLTVTDVSGSKVYDAYLNEGTNSIILNVANGVYLFHVKGNSIDSTNKLLVK